MITNQEWESMKPYRKYKAIDSNNEIVRISREDTTGFHYAKGKQRYGWRYGIDFMLANYTLVPEKTADDVNAAWHKRIARATKAIEGSGLWPDFVEYFHNLALMDYADKTAIHKAYWDTYSRFMYIDSPETKDEYDAVFDEVYGEYITKYPFIIYTDNNGFRHIDSDYIWEKSEVKLKSMYFGKYRNEDYKQQIKYHIKNHQKFTLPRVRTNYDVSFEYNPEKNMAWYSEEYKDCGNGHYYIALDHNTAMFMEDD